MQFRTVLTLGNVNSKKLEMFHDHLVMPSSWLENISWMYKGVCRVRGDNTPECESSETCHTYESGMLLATIKPDTVEF